MTQVFERAAMALRSFQEDAELFFKKYLPENAFILCASVVSGIFVSKMVYDLSQWISVIYFKSYSSLSKAQRVEWNNRAISTVHAIFITIMSLYFVLWSDLFSDHQPGLITFQSSMVSSITLGVSVGYFLVDLGMIFWFYPTIGGMEYVLHHLLSVATVVYAMLTGQGQLYTYIVLISEATTPGINLRWYLDVVGLKQSRAYLVNGVVMFFAWLVARILLFMYLFYHIYLHYDQIMEMDTFALFLAFAVPLVLSVMNLMWFWKIIKGIKKTLAKRRAKTV